MTFGLLISKSLCMKINSDQGQARSCIPNDVLRFYLRCRGKNVIAGAMRVPVPLWGGFPGVRLGLHS